MLTVCADGRSDRFHADTELGYRTVSERVGDFGSFAKRAGRHVPVWCPHSTTGLEHSSGSAVEGLPLRQDHLQTVARPKTLLAHWGWEKKIPLLWCSARRGRQRCQHLGFCPKHHHCTTSFTSPESRSWNGLSPKP